MSDLDLLQRRFDRERAARKEAEMLLEQKSREVYETSCQLRDLAEQNTAIVESAAEGILTYSSDGKILTINRSAERLFGVSRSDSLNVRDLFEAGENAESVLFHCRGELDDATDHSLDPQSDVDSNELVAVRSSGKVFLSGISVSCTTHCEKEMFTVLVRDLSRRKRMEAKLNQAQKMESIGQLAAGIAHEINTPIQFVNDNLQFLQDAFEDLGELLDLFDQLLASVKAVEPANKLVEQIDSQSEVADLPFLKEEFPNAFSQTLDGIQRVAKIVVAMKEFSQPPSEGKSQLDINQAIENALTIAASQFRDVATVKTDLQQGLPGIVCLGAQINQVLLNVLANASEALTEQGSDTKGEILVTTRMIDNDLEIRVEDNGPGIPEHIRDRIFEPFFTTKEVGKGTGQGLAFVYDIVVNRHDGSIQAIASPSGGTTFVIHIPVARVIDTEKREYENSIG